MAERLDCVGVISPDCETRGRRRAQDQRREALVVNANELDEGCRRTLLVRELCKDRRGSRIEVVRMHLEMTVVALVSGDHSLFGEKRAVDPASLRTVECPLRVSRPLGATVHAISLRWCDVVATAVTIGLWLTEAIASSSIVPASFSSIREIVKFDIS